MARMLGARPQAHGAALWLLWGALAVLASGCVPLPVQLTPAVQGRVLDAETGAPVAQAVVVVRFDVRRDERLPERDLLGHSEVLTDAEGRFRLSPEARAGLSGWPLGGAEARVVGVIKDGYRCARPRGVSPSGHVTLELQFATDRDDRRASCRPLAASPAEVPQYLAAWRALYPRGPAAEDQVRQRELDRLAAARATFGFGENCRGPAVDLALAPGGERAAITLETEAGRRVEVLQLVPETRRLALLHPPQSDSRRLGWRSATELVLWEPGALLGPTSESSSTHSLRTLWRSDTAPPGGPRPDALPLQPGDLVDAGAARWGGRSFEILRSVDRGTGFGVETLRVTAADADPVSHALPGEACGPRGQYGRPHFRIDAAGARGLDLRHVDGGCHAVAIDFASGAWRRLDSAQERAGDCREMRRVPLSHLRSALGDYVGELETALLAADGDPRGAYSIHIEPSGQTRLSGRDYMGSALRLEVPPFPLRTPLRRIDVTGVAGAASPPAAPAKELLQPL
jgi:hypothetical protein